MHVSIYVFTFGLSALITNRIMMLRRIVADSGCLGIARRPHIEVCMHVCSVVRKHTRCYVRILHKQTRLCTHKQHACVTVSQKLPTYLR